MGSFYPRKRVVLDESSGYCPVERLASRQMSCSKRCWGESLADSSPFDAEVDKRLAQQCGLNFIDGFLCDPGAEQQGFLCRLSCRICLYVLQAFSFFGPLFDDALVRGLRFLTLVHAILLKTKRRYCRLSRRIQKRSLFCAWRRTGAGNRTPFVLIAGLGRKGCATISEENMR